MRKLFFLGSLVCAIIPLFMVCTEENGVGSNNTPPTVYVNGPSKAYFNDPVDLTSNTKDDGSIVEYAWKIGSTPWRVTSKGDTTITTPTTVQTYICSLRVLDNGGLYGYDYVPISIEASPPIPTVTSNPTSAEINDTVRLHAEASDDIGGSKIINYEWKLGNGFWKSVTQQVIDTSDTSKKDTMLVSDTLIRVPSTVQMYTCSLRVTDDDGEMGYSSITIGVINKPTNPVAVAEPSVASVSTPVKLSGSVTSGNTDIIEWAWKIGYGNWRVTNKDTTIIPEKAEELVCSLRVTNSNNAKYYTSVKVIVKAPDLQAIADADPRVTYVFRPVQLIGDASSSIAADSIVEWAWRVGPKAWNITSSDTTIIPETVGELVCSLRVVDKYGISAKGFVTIKVKPSDLQAIAGADPKVVSLYHPVQLTGDASSPDNDSIVEWAWKVGAKPWKITAKDTTILPEEVGTLICSLRVTSIYGAVAKTNVSITVKAPDLQAIAGQNIKAGLNDSVVLHGKAIPEENIVAYRWKIHTYPWMTSNKDTVIISAPSEQTWCCSLEVIDKYGQVARDKLTLYSMSQPPIAKANAEPAIAAINDTVVLHGEGIDEEGIIQYEWKCGNSPWRQSSKDTTIIVPSTAQIYRCSLKVIDKDYETGFAFVDIRVTAESVIAYAGEDTIIGTDTDIKLHGEELSGTTIAEWWWKIGQNGQWRKTSTSDTTIHTPHDPQTIVCSLKVVSNNNQEGKDAITLYVQSIANNTIVYSRNNSIYTNSIAFNNETYVTNGNDPKWSPDGQKIAFTRAVNNVNYICVMDWNGNNVKQLDASVGGTSPSWYNDNRYIAYGRIYNGQYSIYKIDADGNNNQQVFSIDGVWEESPSVNPSNQNEIAFFYNDGSSSSALYRDIYIHSNAGNIKVRENNDNSYLLDLEIFGDRILWDSERNNRDSLLIVNRNDTANVVTIETSNSGDLRGIFSKDGTSLYYIRTTSSGTYFVRCDLTGNNKQNLGNISGRVEYFDIK